MQKKVYIVVLNWNGLSDARECILSLQKNNYANYEIVVVDNGSTDNSAAILKRAFPYITIIENGINYGFAGGNNIGIEYSLRQGADYILLLNNDTAVESAFLSKLVEAGDSDEAIGLVESKICYYDEPKKIWFAGGKIDWLKTKGTHMGINELDNGQYDNIREVDYLTGCCLLIKRSVFEKIGKLSEDYFLYYEDTDFCLRARNAGFKCIYVPSSKIYHKVSRSTKPGSPSYIYYHTRNGLYLAKKNGGTLNKILLYPFCIYLFVKQILKIAIFPAKRNWALAVLRGERDFLLGKTGKSAL
ncbi:MAG: glycosyltransferase family 2 protein [Candidatus Paceibacterota bacterium]|jgi:hypothetical protein